jgi:hypothetical protein
MPFQAVSQERARSESPCSRTRAARTAALEPLARARVIVAKGQELAPVASVIMFW